MDIMSWIWKSHIWKSKKFQSNGGSYMKSKPCISIIVPVYNVEKYLKKCIDSILKQTFKNFELILVDDGSTDHSGKICDDYEKKDSRICVVHKENGGLSSARNKGIAIAQGDYLGFVDSDDFIASDMYEVLYKNLIKENADLSACGKYDYFIGSKCKIHEPYYMVLNTQEAIKFVLEGGGKATVNVWNKLYRKEIFYSINYPEGKLYEDAFIIVEILMACKRVVFTSEQKYYYRHRAGSITTRCFTKEQFDLVRAYQKNLILVKKYFPQIEDAAAGRLYWANFVVLDKMIALDSAKEYRKEAKQIVMFLRRHCVPVLQCYTLTVSRKISMAVLKFSFSGYKILSQIHSGR